MAKQASVSQSKKIQFSKGMIVVIVIVAMIITPLVVFYLRSLSSGKEKRAVWYVPYVLSSNVTEGRIQLWTNFSLYRTLNITDVFLLAKENYVYYNSSIGVKNPAYDWDVLGSAVEFGEELGLRVHAWVNVMSNHLLIAGNSSLACVNASGNPSWDWVNPVLPEVQNYTLAIMSEIVSNYNVSGVQLDYIRYENNQFSYDAYSRGLFEASYGFDPVSNQSSSEWASWRCDVITNLTKEIKTVIKSVNLRVKYSCACFAGVDASTSVFQNVSDWSEQRIFDYLCPMTYNSNVGAFEESVKAFMGVVASKSQVLCGIDVYDISFLNSTLRESVFVGQVDVCRKYGADGWVLFRDEFVEPFIDYFSELDS